MANWMLTPTMLSKMVICWLPTGAYALAWEEDCGDVIVQWGNCAFIHVAKNDRLLSMDAWSAAYKPQVDAKLIETWTLVENECPLADQWSPEEMASSLGHKPYSFNRIPL